MIRRAMAKGRPATDDIGPLPMAIDADDDCNCVLTTSNGLVRQAATVPATPPENKLNSFILVADMVLLLLLVVVLVVTMDEVAPPLPLLTRSTMDDDDDDDDVDDKRHCRKGRRILSPQS